MILTQADIPLELFWNVAKSPSFIVLFPNTTPSIISPMNPVSLKLFGLLSDNGEDSELISL